MKVLDLDSTGVLPILDDTHVFIARIKSGELDLGYSRIMCALPRVCEVLVVSCLNPYVLSKSPLTILVRGTEFRPNHINPMCEMLLKMARTYDPVSQYSITLMEFDSIRELQEWARENHVTC